jgi:hypothetical protein
MCGTAAEAFDGVNGSFAADGRGVVAQHMTPGALNKRRAVAAMDERDLPAKHVDTLLGSALGDDVSVVYVRDKNGGGVLSQEYRVALPVRGSTYEGF